MAQKLATRIHMVFLIKEKDAYDSLVSYSNTDTEKIIIIIIIVP